MQQLRSFLLFAILFIAQSVLAQTGFPPFGSFENGSFDATNRQNLNTNFAIPITSSPGRGISLDMSLVYDSLIYTRGPSSWSPTLDGTGNPNWGWKMTSPFGATTHAFTANVCIDPSGLKVFGADHYYLNYYYKDGAGTSHPFPVFVHEKLSCGWGYTGTYTGSASDNSGYRIDITPPNNLANPIVYSPSGMKMVGSGTINQVTDPNGNFITRSAASNITTWTDTLNRSAVSITDNLAATPPTMVYGFLDENGSPLNVQVNYTAYSIKTNFHCTGLTDYTSTGTVALPTQIIFLPGDPHQLTYSITYEDTPGFSGFKTGRISQVTLPTGGSYQYQYYVAPGNPAVDHGGVNCADGSYTYLTKTISDGTTANTWGFTRNLATGKITETPPGVAPDSGAHTVYTFNASGQQTVAVFYSAATEDSVHTLKTINTSWAANGTPATQVTILDNNKQSQVTTNFDSNGILQSQSQYDYGAGVVGPLIRTTTLTYLSTSTYLAKNIINRVTQQKVTNSGGTVISRIDIAYDCYTSPCAGLASAGYTGVSHHDDTNYGVANTVRGNPTQITKYANAAAGTGQLTTTLSYNILGNVMSSADPKGNTTTLTYTDSWNTAACSPPGGAQAYVTGVTNALGQSASSKYNSCTGTLASNTDLNGKTSSYTYDGYRRPLTASLSDGGSAIVSYTDGANPVINTTQSIDVGKSLNTSSHLDGLGRTVQTTKSTPAGTIYADTSYDARGNVASVSNPHYSTSSPTDGVTTFQYDGLGRQIKVINPDASVAQAAFKGSSVALADEGNGNTNPVEKLQQYDALGRLIKVCEVTSVSQMGSDATPAACGFDLNAISTHSTGFSTAYAYDQLDNLLTVNQGSALMTRTFAYDSLSRLTSSAIPETTNTTDPSPRATTYSYTASGGALCSGDPSSPCIITDPRAITTTLSYDAMNRVTQKQYSDGTPTDAYFYDESTSAGLTLLNTKGRLSHSVSAGGSAASYFSYDSVGRMQDNWQCTPATCGSSSFPMHYTYDFLGNVLSRSDLSGSITYTYTYDSAAQLSQMQMTANSVTNTILSGLSYNPLGQVTGATLGSTGSSMALTRAYNSRGQLLYMQNGSIYSIGSSGNPILYYPNGSIRALPDSVNGSWTYAYDDFNRAASAAQSGGPTYTWDYDRFGNRWHQYANGSTISSLIFDNKNHVASSGYAYDALGSGNMTNDGFNIFTWDAANRLATVNGAGASYTYDASGARVQKTTGAGSSQYLFDMLGNATEELTGSTLNRAEIYLGSAHLGTYTGGNIYFSHTDMLGHERARTLSTAPGANTQTCTNLPFGDGQSCTGTETSPLHFTGLQRDTETGLDQTLFRKYSSSQGRWLTPDPFSGSLDITDPQSANRYAYVRNDPLNGSDPLGLVRTCSGWSGGPFDDGGHFTDCENIAFPDFLPGKEDKRNVQGSKPGPAPAKKPCPITVAIGRASDRPNDPINLLPEEAQLVHAIFADAGIDLQFVTNGTPNFIVGFTSIPPAKGPGLLSGLETPLLGYAPPGTKVALVDRSRIGGAIAIAGTQMPYGIVEGRVMAHELGHKLGIKHSDAGIMRDGLDMGKDLFQLIGGLYLFTPEQKRQLQAACQALQNANH
jgi:RHS repeat-associated protein